MITAEDKLRWKLRSVSGPYRRNLDHAVRTISDALKSAQFVVSWSAGKDSTAMAHLVRTISPSTPVMIQFDDCDWPAKRPYADRINAQHKFQAHYVYPTFSVRERMNAGRIGEEQFCAVSHPLTKDAFLRPLAAKQAELGCDGVFMGLRSAESSARRLNHLRRGPLYQLKSGEWRCCPIALWTAEDVFAYHVANSLEINPCYSSQLRNPEDIRISWAIPTPQSLGRGGMEQIRRHDPVGFRSLRGKVSY